MSCSISNSEVCPSALMLVKSAFNSRLSRGFSPAVPRHVRALINGDAKFRGYALRIVPDRSVDDGWTVRVQLPEQPQVYLEVDTYADTPATAKAK